MWYTLGVLTFYNAFLFSFVATVLGFVFKDPVDVPMLKTLTDSRCVILTFLCSYISGMVMMLNRIGDSLSLVKVLMLRLAAPAEPPVKSASNPTRRRARIQPSSPTPLQQPTFEPQAPAASGSAGTRSPPVLPPLQTQE